MSTETVTDETHARLTGRIRRGVYAAGSRLPGERQLAAELGVSRTTLRSALQGLADDGLVTRSAQRGWFVATPTLGEPPSTLQSFSEMAYARGLRPSTQVLEQQVRPATMEEADKLAIAPAAPVIELVRLRGMDGIDVCVDTVVVNHARAAPLADVDLNGRSLYDELFTRCGLEVYRSAYSVQAVGAEPRIAELLHIAPGAPVLVGREVAYTADGVPLLVGVNYYRGEAYRFEADLYRRQR